MSEDRLMLEGTLDDLVRLPPWIDQLAATHGIAESVRFAINVCLEEVLSNIIRHGHASESNKRITVRFAQPDTASVVFSIDDEAPHFNPLVLPELPALSSGEALWIGGHGLRLLRQFAGTMEYDQLPNGNRLTLSFSIQPRS